MNAVQRNLNEKFDVTGRMLLLKNIKPHPLNPRKEFDQQQLQSLADSMQEVGLLEPVIVRKLPGSKSGYQLIAGARRLKAAVLAGWDKIAAIVKNVTDAEALAMQLVENLHRADLNCIEIARGLEQLYRPESEGGCGKNHAEVAQLIGKSKEWVCGRIRVLVLPEVWQARLASGEIDFSFGLKLCPYAKQPEFLARLEADMVKNPWAYRTYIDFTNSLRELAEETGITGKIDPRTSTAPVVRKRKEPAKRLSPSEDDAASGNEIDCIAEVDGPEPHLVAFPMIQRDGSSDLLPAILAAIDTIDDFEQLAQIGQAVQQRLSEVRARQAGDAHLAAVN